ncbi:hypothetical protein MOO45_02905 [Bombilactobacillus folatiphilus]|uniref:Uncharacterized protein n=1 Tax=Bombilactobacillus folatiphilus TaxID=2923362 RepID=A0ABY4PAB5_9LACO|nr:hypothetical protein [Bombilactobacillus folatiphilus]UQS82613.1 hypothetical protein MOO45_02905 [Bombilactobacillus folatiphilus]
MDYQAVATKLAIKVANLELANSILESNNDAQAQVINDLKLKHPGDFDSDETGGN